MQVGEVIYNHDTALGWEMPASHGLAARYVLQCMPEVLPSYAGLPEAAF